MLGGILAISNKFIHGLPTHRGALYCESSTKQIRHLSRKAGMFSKHYLDFWQIHEMRKSNNHKYLMERPVSKAAYCGGHLSPDISYISSGLSATVQDVSPLWCHAIKRLDVRQAWITLTVRAT